MTQKSEISRFPLEIDAASRSSNVSGRVGARWRFPQYAFAIGSGAFFGVGTGLFLPYMETDQMTSP